MVVLDANYMKTKEEAHKYLQEQLQLPQYYGKNLDALHDCLTEMDKLEVCFCNMDIEQSYAKKIRKIFLYAKKENPGLQVMER